jgi:DNA adenine methylase/adenine-specific DNA-methyltransferase
MGSKYRLAPRLAEIFEALPGGPALDAFSGSGVVSYTLKLTGRSVLANDHLAFTARIASGLIANDWETLTENDLDRICSGNADRRSFIAETFDGLYFPAEDHAFLDAAWSQLETLSDVKQDLAIIALCLAAARKQPRGVFTFTTPRYDDGRRHLRMSLQALFLEAAAEVNDAVFEGAGSSSAVCDDVFDLPQDGFALAYFDPPYAPPRDDTCYIKRYHFLEGLATYWRGQTIMWETRTRKLAKRFTPFSYKRSAPAALDRLFGHFRGATLVVSYGSNAALSSNDLEDLLSRHRRSVERIEIPHRYAFGTHDGAQRRQATEYIYIAE